MQRHSLLPWIGLICVCLFAMVPPVHAADRDDSLSLNNLPMIPGAERVAVHHIDREHLEAKYLLSLDPGTAYREAGQAAVSAADDLLERFRAAGWEAVRQSRRRRGAEIILRKDGLYEVKAVIGAVSLARGGGMQPHVRIDMRYSRRIPFQDIVGRDPLDVPRFPGSVRVRWMNLLGDFAAKYLVQADPGEVKAFLAREALRRNWRPHKGGGDLHYAKDGPAGAGAPSTLSFSVTWNDGIVEIGVGRRAGTSERGLDPGTLETTVTPEAPRLSPPSAPPDVPDIEKALPVPTGLERVSREDLPVNERGEDTVRLTYMMEDAPMTKALEVAEFYKTRLPAAGWKLLEEEWFGIGRTLRLRRGPVQATVKVNAVGRYPVPENAPRIDIPVQVDLTFDLPRLETTGENIPGIPAYPGSVRFFSLKAGSDHIVKFKVVAGLDEVERFFVNQLPKAGWRFAGNDATGLLFVPASTPTTAADAPARGKLIPPTLKIKVDDFDGPTVMIGMDFTRGN